MALTRTLAQLRADVRKFANVQGTTALQRHPDADVNDYINRALGALHRRLTAAQPDQRYLSSTSASTSDGTSTYSLPADFDHLISVDLTANSVKRWLVAYEMHERAGLTSPDTDFVGIPFSYRLRGGNIEFLPTPESDDYTYTLWYVPTPRQFATSGDDAQTFDTVNRLDDYIIAHAAKTIAVKDKQWDLVGECRNVLAEMEAEIAVIGRGRDQNSPPRIVDEMLADRWGRRRRRLG